MNEHRSVETVNLNLNNPPPKFTFNSGGPNNTWLIEITAEGIKFNREFFPDTNPDEFAKAFIEILEKNFEVSFTKKI